MIPLVFIGGGINSAVGRAHYAACRMDGKFELIAGCFSRDLGVGAGTMVEYHARKTFSSPERAIDYAVINNAVVVVLTPTPDHFSIVQQCQERHIAVICEKSLAATAEQTAALCKTAVENKSFLAVTYTYTGYPMLRELRELISTGSLGKIVSVQAEMPQEGYLRNGVNPQFWRREDGQIPAVHLDLGTHLHHLIWYLTGSTPVRLVAQQAGLGNFGVIDDVSAIVRYSAPGNREHEFVANVWFGKAALGCRNGLRIHIYGTEAAAEWIQTNPEELTLATTDGHRIVMDRADSACLVANQPRYQRFKAGHPAGYVEALANVYADLHDDLLTGTVRKEYGASVAHNGLLMMADIVKSAKERRWV